VRPGTAYEVRLEYACEPSNEGGAFELTVGGAALEGSIAEATGSWESYRWMELGELTVGDEERATVTLRATRLPEGKALMNLRRVVLVPQS
jgi:hypothetical protein